MQLTTREAVKDALICMATLITYDDFSRDEERNKTEAAMQLLCEHYGFKLDQFFDVEAVE